MIFKDRSEAGRQLAKKIIAARPDYLGSPNLLVLGVARGGVVVAAEVAKVFKCPLDVVVVRKLGAPGRPEYAFGAVDLDGRTVLNRPVVNLLGLSEEEIKAIGDREWQEARRRESKFRPGKRPLKVSGMSVIVVDDGIATGATSVSAVNYLLAQNPARIILATPVIAARTAEDLGSQFRTAALDFSIVFLEAPQNFSAVGEFYRSFSQVSDAEVVELLRRKN